MEILVLQGMFNKINITLVLGIWLFSLLLSLFPSSPSCGDYLTCSMNHRKSVKLVDFCIFLARLGHWYHLLAGQPTCPRIDPWGALRWDTLTTGVSSCFSLRFFCYFQQCNTFSWSNIITLSFCELVPFMLYTWYGLYMVGLCVLVCVRQCVFAFLD